MLRSVQSSGIASRASFWQLARDTWSRCEPSAMKKASSKVDLEQRQRSSFLSARSAPPPAFPTHTRKFAQEVEAFFRSQWKSADAVRTDSILQFLQQRRGRGIQLAADRIASSLKDMNRPNSLDAWGITPKALWILTMAQPIFVEKVYSKFCRFYQKR